MASAGDKLEGLVYKRIYCLINPVPTRTHSAVVSRDNTQTREAGKDTRRTLRRNEKKSLLMLRGGWNYLRIVSSPGFLYCTVLLPNGHLVTQFRFCLAPVPFEMPYSYNVRSSLEVRRSHLNEHSQTNICVSTTMLMQSWVTSGQVWDDRLVSSWRLQ
jgi:hypothetical protein